MKPNELHPAAVELTSSKRMGRPTDMTPEVVTKLIAAFNNGFNVSEACYYANISRTTYYRWIEADADFSDKMEWAQTAVNSKAKEIVVKAITEGDANLAFRYLQARDPDFKPKFEGELGHHLQETRNKIKGFLDDPDTSTSGTPDAEGGDESSTTSGDAGGGEVAAAPGDIS